MIDKGNEIIAKSIFQKIKPIIENDLYEYQY